MALNFKDLVHKRHEGRECIGFETAIKQSQETEVLCTFKRIMEHDGTLPVWSMQVVTPRTRDKDSEVYRFEYRLPKDNIPLELVAAIGLKYLQLYLKQEVQAKSELDFVIGEMVGDM